MVAKTLTDLDAITTGSDKVKLRDVAILTPKMIESILTLTDLSDINVLMQLISLFNKREESDLTRLAATNTTINEHIDPDTKQAPASPTQDQIEAVRAETSLNFGDV